jgi:DNA-binding response OmpR family regulator
MTTLLIVDDSEIILKLVTAAFRSDDYEILTAQTGHEALEICRLLRQAPSTAHLPILMLTGFSQLENRLMAFEAGADDFIAKPFQIEELQARIKVHLRHTEQYLPRTENGIRIHRVAVFSLRGGVGVSTLAVNLAVGLMQLWGEPPLLVNLALLSGQAALLLDLKCLF